LICKPRSNSDCRASPNNIDALGFEGNETAGDRHDGASAAISLAIGGSPGFGEVFDGRPFDLRPGLLNVLEQKFDQSFEIFGIPADDRNVVPFLEQTFRQWSGDVPRGTCDYEFHRDFLSSGRTIQ
jgi:hypothetical protein